jgi:hypothetical protein
MTGPSDQGVAERSAAYQGRSEQLGNVPVLPASHHEEEAAVTRLIQSTAIALALGLSAVPGFTLTAAAQDLEVCSDFGMIDANDNDVLERAEYAGWSDEVFDDWDQDDDGAVSEDEFDRCFEAGGWFESELDDGWEDDADELFAAWDDDDDGALAEAEFADEEEFDEWDADDDDDVDDQEFLIDGFLF